MTTLHHTRQYRIKSYWGPRGETLEAIANRYTRTVDALVRIYPVFIPWWYGGIEGTTIPFDQARARLPALIAENIGEEWGPRDGYPFFWANALDFKSSLPQP